MWILLSYYVLWPSGEIVWRVNPAERILEEKQQTELMVFDSLLQYAIQGPYHSDNTEKKISNDFIIVPSSILEFQF